MVGAVYDVLSSILSTLVDKCLVIINKSLAGEWLVPFCNNFGLHERHVTFGPAHGVISIRGYCCNTGGMCETVIHANTESNIRQDELSLPIPTIVGSNNVSVDGVLCNIHPNTVDLVPPILDLATALTKS